MKIFLIILGAAMGASAMDPSVGIWIGGLLAYLLLRVSELGREIGELREQIDTGQEIVASLSQEKVTQVQEEADSKERDATREQKATQAAYRAAIDPAVRTADSKPKAEEITPLETEAGPDLWDKVYNFYVKHVGDRNPIVVLGIVVLFFGLGFFLKHAVNEGIINLSVELRLLSVSILAFILFGWGWTLNAKRPDFAATLQGGAIGMLYLTIFTAYRFYSLISAGLAFAIFIPLVLLCGYLALKYNSLVLAVLGSSGGFLAPILASSGSGSHVQLFSFYLLLNLGIFFLAWSRSWAFLNLVGFAFTFVLGLAWGHKFYKPEFFWSVEPFLLGFFVLYLAILILLALRKNFDNRSLSSALLFVLPTITFLLQEALVSEFENGLAWSAFGFALFYLLLSLVIRFYHDRLAQVFSTVFDCISIIFFALAIPCAFDSTITAAAWALSGAGMFYLGMKDDRSGLKWIGGLLQFFSSYYFMASLDDLEPTRIVLNSEYLGFLILSLTGLYSSFNSFRFQEKDSESGQPLTWLFLCWWLFWWLSAGVNEIENFVSSDYRFNSYLALFTLTALLSETLAGLKNWPQARFASSCFLFVVLVFVINLFGGALAHPFEAGGAFVWPLACALLYYNIFSLEKLDGHRRSVRHALSFLILSCILAWEAWWVAETQSLGKGEWAYVAVALILALEVLLLCIGKKFFDLWPLKKHRDFYISSCSLPLILYILTFAVASSGRSLDPWPFSYYPILNPLDLVQLLLFMTLVVWQREAQRAGIIARDLRGVIVAIGCVAFLWINTIVARSIHHWAGIDYQFYDLFQSALFQSGLSIVWGVLALLLIVIASRNTTRWLWLLGAFIILAVVVKLFLIDLAKTGTIERIVSFVAIGILMVIIGYISPLPPQDD